VKKTVRTLCVFSLTYNLRCLSPATGRGQEKITVSSLAPFGGEGARRAGEGGYARNRRFEPKMQWSVLSRSGRKNLAFDPQDVANPLQLFLPTAIHSVYVIAVEPIDELLHSAVQTCKCVRPVVL
jgi:hypothetical protein